MLRGGGVGRGRAVRCDCAWAWQAQGWGLDAWNARRWIGRERRLAAAAANAQRCAIKARHRRTRHRMRRTAHPVRQPGGSDATPSDESGWRRACRAGTADRAESMMESIVEYSARRPLPPSPCTCAGRNVAGGPEPKGDDARSARSTDGLFLRAGRVREREGSGELAGLSLGSWEGARRATAEYRRVPQEAPVPHSAPRHATLFA